MAIAKEKMKNDNTIPTNSNRVRVLYFESYHIVFIYSCEKPRRQSISQLNQWKENDDPIIGNF